MEKKYSLLGLLNKDGKYIYSEEELDVLWDNTILGMVFGGAAYYYLYCPNKDKDKEKYRGRLIEYVIDSTLHEQKRLSCLLESLLRME